MIYQPIPDKRCTQCKQWFVATTEFFRAKKSVGRLHSSCRFCEREAHGIWRENHPNASAIRARKWRQKNPDRKRQYVNRYFEEHKAHLQEKNRQWRENNRDHIRKRDNANSRQWRKEHPDRRKAIQKRYTSANRDKILERHRQHRRNNPEKGRVYVQRRLARKRQLPSTFTNANWKRCLDYWHGCCAYCGNPPSLFDINAVLHQEHHVPLSRNGGYTPDNIVPACQSCNLSKANKMPEEWAIEHFGKKKGKAILKGIQNYFEWLESR